MSNEHLKSAMDIFASVQESFGEAKKKMADESRQRNSYLRMSKDGTYLVRILPLAPEIDADGNVLPMKRKGYEYPLRDLLLKIEDTSSKDAKGKPKTLFVSVCNVKYAFPQLKNDLIDKFVEVASNKYADDEALIKKLKENSFSGGIRWSSHRCMYVLDVDNREEGIQILQLSFAQYKELEERKINLWQKLLKKNPNALCPISSPNGAYPIEIIRKTDAKTNYSINIAVEEDKDELSEEELQALLDAPQLPTVLYRYTRYHLEATIVFLQQLQERFDIDVLEDEEIKDTIDQIKMVLPADDQSHFTFGGSGNSSSNNNGNDIDALWDTYEQLQENGLEDRSTEGQELRASIKEFIEANGLNVRISRGKSNLELLNAIEAEMNGDDPEDVETTNSRASKPEPEDDDDEDDGNNDASEEEEPEDDKPATPTRRRRNDDTNEPAARPERRAARPTRRRS